MEFDWVMNKFENDVFDLILYVGHTSLYILLVKAIWWEKDKVKVDRKKTHKFRRRNATQRKGKQMEVEEQEPMQVQEEGY